MKIYQQSTQLYPQRSRRYCKDILELIAQSLEEGNRIEVRGFGSFSLHHRQPRVGRNPKTGDSVKLDAKSVPHFKAGKELKDRVNVFA